MVANRLACLVHEYRVHDRQGYGSELLACYTIAPEGTPRLRSSAVNVMRAYFGKGINDYAGFPNGMKLIGPETYPRE